MSVKVRIMSKRRVKLSDQIRRAIDAAGVSRYSICRTTGIGPAAMSRFMQGRQGMTLANLDRLADVLGLAVVARGPVRVLPRAKPGPKTGSHNRKAGES